MLDCCLIMTQPRVAETVFWCLALTPVKMHLLLFVPLY